MTPQSKRSLNASLHLCPLEDMREWMSGSAWCQGEREVVFTRSKEGEVVSKDHYLHYILPVLLNKTAFKSEDAGTNMPTFYRFVLLTVCVHAHICVRKGTCVSMLFAPVCMGLRKGHQMNLKLQAFVDCDISAGNWTQSPCRSIKCCQSLGHLCTPMPSSHHHAETA